jgi:hypothetical protein
VSVIGFELIHRGCAFLYDRLCPVLLGFLDLILNAARLVYRLPSGEKKRKQSEHCNRERSFHSTSLDAAVILRMARLRFAPWFRQFQPNRD